MTIVTGNQPSRIYVTGASCAGVTTLGAHLATALGVKHIDVDHHYWLPTEPPFTTKRTPTERIESISAAQGDGDWVLTGSFDGWGDALIANAQLVVFVVTPTPVRMQRLFTREKQRYGSRIEPGGDMHDIHRAFADWASRYDDPDFTSRSRHRHEAWLAQQQLPVLRADGTEPPETLAEHVLKHALSRTSQ